jgi:hypothetical protein
MIKRKDMAFVPIEGINNSIHLVRGQRVIVDRDLAAIYGVETRTLNQAVKRNAERFPTDFMFQLTREEAMASRSQAVILKAGRGHNIKFLPYVFTEHGAIQASNVLNSPRAVMMGIHVVRAFVQLRDLLASNKELAHKFAELERKLATHDQAITGIIKTIRELMNPPVPKKQPIGFVYPEEKK